MNGHRCRHVGDNGICIYHVFIVKDLEDNTQGSLED